MESFNPYTGKPWALIPRGTPEDVERAVAAARKASQTRYLPEWFRYFAGLADKLEGRVIPIDRPGMFNFTLEEPLGVIAAIVPWNSPLLLAAWKMAPALTAGNTLVWKPSEQRPARVREFVQEKSVWIETRGVEVPNPFIVR